MVLALAGLSTMTRLYGLLGTLGNRVFCVLAGLALADPRADLDALPDDFDFEVTIEARRVVTVKLYK